MKYRKIKKHWKYQLLRSVGIMTKIYPDQDISTPFITLFCNGNLIIHKGYAWDGPSGPTIDTKDFMRGSLIHDALYQLMREGFIDINYRKYADQLLVDICREDGMAWWRAGYVYWAVRLFAGRNARPKDNKSF